MSIQAVRAAATGNPSAAQPKGGPLATFQRYLTDYGAQLTAALPKHQNAERLSRLAMTTVSQNRDLMRIAQENPKSIFGAVVLSAQMGLEIGVSGQGYIVPYGNVAQFVPGWQGIVDLVSRTGRATVWTGAVFVGDDFDYSLGDRPFIKHRPNDEDDPSKLTHVYAVGRVNGQEWPVIEVWKISKVLRHRDKHNKVGKKHYSFNNLEMYARKIPLLQVCKYMPKSIELTAALSAEVAAETGGRLTFDGEFSVVEPPADEPGAGEFQPTGEAGEAAPTYAELAERAKAAKTEDDRAQVLADSGHLPADQQAELQKLLQPKAAAGRAAKGAADLSAASME